MPLALITGGAKRIGASIALGLAQAGFDIALHVNSSKKDGEVLLKELRSLGGEGAIVRTGIEQAW